MRQAIHRMAMDLLDELTPRQVVCAACQTDPPPPPAHPREEALIRTAVAERRHSFRAGRRAAHHALASLGHDCEVIFRGENREPIWPRGCIGSISHTRHVSVATAAQTEDIRALGVDIESARGLSREEWSLVLQDDEFLKLERLGSSADRLAMLTFSAKETIFKLQFPHTGRFVDFREARIDLSEQHSTFEAFLPDFVHEKLGHPAPFRGRYGSCADSIVTVAWVENH